MEVEERDELPFPHIITEGGAEMRGEEANGPFVSPPLPSEEMVTRRETIISPPTGAGKREASVLPPTKESKRRAFVLLQRRKARGASVPSNE